MIILSLAKSGALRGGGVRASDWLSKGRRFESRLRRFFTPTPAESYLLLRHATILRCVALSMDEKYAVWYQYATVVVHETHHLERLE